MTEKQPPCTVSPAVYEAVIFDLDGVITQTAKIHASAWKKTFDGYLKERSNRLGVPYEPFDENRDYVRHVDGKPRYDGVRDFLDSRGIHLDHGSIEDSPETRSVCGLGNRKNQRFLEELEAKGVTLYDHALELIEKLRRAGIRTAVVSSSKNCRHVLDAAGISHLLDATVDGVDSQKMGLRGKPSPAIFLEAAKRLSVSPRRAVVVEDALAGVQAGSSGGFGCVVGVDRQGDRAEALRGNGATHVVSDLGGIVVGETSPEGRVPMDSLPNALERMAELKERMRGRTACVFLDYDGTLTPIVQRPEQAILSEPTRRTLQELAQACTVAVISGRDLADVRGRVGLEGIVYAGSHGFDMAGPGEAGSGCQEAARFLPALDAAQRQLEERLTAITGCLVERKKFSVAVHYRQVREDAISKVKGVVDEVLEGHGDLRKSYGKKVIELQPDMDWDKGKALLRLLQTVEREDSQCLPFYLGDDITDEDAFGVLRNRGVGIVVKGEENRSSAARYVLEDPEQVRRFLVALTETLEQGGV